MHSQKLCELTHKYHLASKIVNAYDLTTKTQANINVLKFEMFVFDIYPLIPDSLNTFGCLEARRQEEFAPIKNPEGQQDSPSTARFLIS